MTNIRKFNADETGQTSIEWVLLVVAFGLPMVYLVSLLLNWLTEYYAFLTCLISLPMS